MVRIKCHLSTAYHPETDGQTEHDNQEIEAYLRIFINYHQNNLNQWCSMMEFSFNNRIHSATGYSPFFLEHGYHPYTGIELLRDKNPRSKGWVESLSQTRENANASLKLANEAMKRSFDKHRNESREYQKGDWVWLEGMNVRTAHPSKKLDILCHGPYIVEEKVGSSSYRLQLPKDKGWNKKHPVFNEKLLKPYFTPKFEIQESQHRPPPEIVDDHEEFEVKTIIDSRKRGCGIEYLVHWKGYSNDEDTWEPRTNVGHAQDLIDQFHKDHLTKLKPIRQLKGVVLRMTDTITGKGSL